MRRGDIYYADLDPVIGSEQGGYRPVLIVQNNVGNKHSPTTIIAAITTKYKKPEMPTHIVVSAEEANLGQDSIILLEQIRTVDKERLKEKISSLDQDRMFEVGEALNISLGITPSFPSL